MITLSASEDNGIRLLDEGTVVTAEGNVWFYIEKGALRRYLDTLDDDFVGYIKYGHNDFANDPVLLGSFKKSDFTLQDMGDGRESLYVNPTFFDTYRLRDIKSMPFDVGVSVEMDCFTDDEATEAMGFSVYKDLFIHGFAVVGDAGNVNSSGVRLSGGEKVAFDLKAVNDALENQSQIDLAALKDALEKFEDKKEETVEETVEASVEEEVEEQEETEEVEASVEEEQETSVDDILAKVEELTAKVEELTAENKSLADSIETLEADKATLAEKLSAKEAEEKKFVEKFKSLTLHVSDPKEEPDGKEVSLAMDGIGEL